MNLATRIRNRIYGEPLAACRTELLSRMLKGSVCAEIGVYKGEFSQHILKVVRPQKLHLIDPWFYETAPEYERTWYGGKTGVDQQHMDSLYESVCRKFQKAIDAGAVIIHRGKSGDVLAGFPEDYFDWVYIDGNHAYEFVKEDLRQSLRVLKPGGYLAGDDYHLSGWWGDGVTRAVDEMRAVCATKMILEGQFILQKPEKNGRTRNSGVDFAGARSSSV